MYISKYLIDISMDFETKKFKFFGSAGRNLVNYTIELRCRGLHQLKLNLPGNDDIN